MALESRLQSLARRHQEIEATIALEMRHPNPDDVRMSELKRLKLQLKDQMLRLRKREPAVT